MPTQDRLPTHFRELAGAVVVLEAAAGAARRAALDAWADAARADGAEAWVVSCGVSRSGIWGGLNTWLEDLLPRLRAGAPDLVTRHDRELTAALPRLKREIAVRHLTLTETAQDDEAVRNFALDRAYRIPQGLIDMLEAWHRTSGAGRWVVACDEFDTAGALTARFFRELVRRRGKALELTLLVAAAPAAGGAVAAGFA
ncbi:MAG: Tetratricopeptide 2 repeat protein, partial [Gemmatimonadetes bacterium]|nr:Tetratricopeptide 2 repeat protein [Gemmatimonadota bacterium]